TDFFQRDRFLTPLPPAALLQHDPNASLAAPTNEDATSGLRPWTYLCVGAPVMLRTNENVADGLANGARGIIHRINWQEGGPLPPPNFADGDRNRLINELKCQNVT